MMYQILSLEIDMKITQHYSADSQDVLSWDELKVGAIYFHIWLQLPLQSPNL